MSVAKTKAEKARLEREGVLAAHVRGRPRAGFDPNTLARRFIIDFSDYRPYAAAEKRGEQRPHPYQRDIMLPASGLPLFA